MCGRRPQPNKNPNQDFLTRSLRDRQETSPSPLCFPQVKPQVSNYPLPRSVFLKLFLRFKFEKMINLLKK